MYEQQFGFHSRPFPAIPADWKLFQSESVAKVLPAVRHVLRTDGGIAVVTGPGGGGKTVLLYHLRELLRREGRAMVLSGASLNSTLDLHTAIERQLDDVVTGDHSATSGSVSSRRWEVVELLQRMSELWGPLALLVDDAHLVGADVFTELQFLLEQRQTPQALCRVLLAGPLSLEETLCRPALMGFAQRIRSWMFVEPLRLNESVDFLRHQLSSAGGSLESVFDAQAVEAIVQAADGNPRCVNLLADESLMQASQKHQLLVTSEIVHAALKSLRHLPHAWIVPISGDSESSADESGSEDHSVELESEGVIEVGAPRKYSSSVEDAENVLLSANFLPPTVDLRRDSEQIESTNVAPSDAGEKIWLPDDLSTPAEESVENSPETDGAAITVESESDPKSGFPDGLWDPETVELVGSPAMEVDEALDSRLLQMAEYGHCSSAADESADQKNPASVDSLPTWTPAGSGPPDLHASMCVSQFGHCEDANAADREEAGLAPSPSSLRRSEADVAEFHFQIPVSEDPVSTWPSAAEGVSPPDFIPVLPLDDASVQYSPADTGLPEKPPSVTGCEVAVTAAVNQPVDDTNVSRGTKPNTTSRYDGRLLQNVGQPPLSHFVPPGSDGAQKESLVLRITDMADEQATAVPDDVSCGGVDKLVPERKRLFTLPITFEGMLGKQTEETVNSPVSKNAGSVDVLGRQRDHRQPPNPNQPTETKDDPSSESRTLPRAECVENPTENEGGRALAEFSGAGLLTTEEDVFPGAMLLRRSLMSSAPVLRAAAGAESLAPVQPSDTLKDAESWTDTMEVVNSPMPVKHAEGQSTSAEARTYPEDDRRPVTDFRNLFTRLRARSA